MKVLELHILQSFPVTCLNRDDVGAPKSAIFGGSSRARVSSQCWKRAIREEAKKIESSFFAANRTRFLVNAFEKDFVAKGKENARLLAVAAADAIGTIDDIEKGMVTTLLFFSPNELSGVVDTMIKCEFGDELSVAYDPDEKDKEKKKKALKKVQDKITKSKAIKAFGGKVKDAADISIFGRMVADDHSLMVEGAGMFAHALSTHKVSTEIDFFTAVDDVEGVGHLNTLEFNSACYYRYIALNLDLLADESHLGHFSDEELKSVVDAFVRASILAVPNARKNSMMGFNPPEYVLGTIREGQPISLANAFENPVISRGKGFVEPSIQALEEKFQWMKDTYGFTSCVEKKIPEVGMDDFCKELIANDC